MSIILIQRSLGIHSKISVNYATPICIKRQAELTQKTDARTKKEAEAHAAKWQAESTQEEDARRELPRPRQLSGNLDPTSHSYTF